MFKTPSDDYADRRAYDRAGDKFGKPMNVERYAEPDIQGGGQNTPLQFPLFRKHRGDSERDS
ncbi:MAG: hypothetical protein ACREGC_03770, partial [Minisyncoccia bacterium]